MTKNYKLVIDDEKGRLDKVIAEKITDLREIGGGGVE